MTIIWCGGEDIDFPNGAQAPTVVTSAYGRSTYARCTLASGLNWGSPFNWIRSNAFTPLTSFWFSCQMQLKGGLDNYPLIGLSQTGSTSAFFLYNSSNYNGIEKMCILTFDGTNAPVIASESGYSLYQDQTLKIDFQMINYGASSTINVYVNAKQVINWTGNSTISGLTAFDSVILGTRPNAYFSEIIVANEDTRRMSLYTMPPNNAGTYSQWIGSYTDVNEITLDQTHGISTSTVGNVETFSITPLPGNQKISAMTLKGQATCGTTGPQYIEFEVLTNSTLYNANTISLTTSYKTIEEIFLTNPVTTSPWLYTEVNVMEAGVKALSTPPP